MRMTTETIDAVLTETHEYERKNLGVKYGEDFPEIARALVSSQRFEGFLLGNFAMMALTMMRRKAEDAQGDQLIQELRESPMRDILAELFYAGYKLGRKAAEVDSLSHLGGGRLTAP